MFYHFIYLAKGIRMRPKVRSTLNRSVIEDVIDKQNVGYALKLFSSEVEEVLVEKGKLCHCTFIGQEMLIDLQINKNKLDQLYLFIILPPVSGPFYNSLVFRS